MKKVLLILGLLNLTVLSQSAKVDEQIAMDYLFDSIIKNRFENQIIIFNGYVDSNSTNEETLCFKDYLLNNKWRAKENDIIKKEKLLISNSLKVVEKSNFFLNLFKRKKLKKMYVLKSVKGMSNNTKLVQIIILSDRVYETNYFFEIDVKTAGVIRHCATDAVY